MVRITETDVTVDGTKLRLDGKLGGPWVREIRLVCDPILAKGQQIQIDCSGVSSLDSDGIARFCKGCKERESPWSTAHSS